MPQLNPSPWFCFMILSWLSLLIVVPPKVMAHLFPNVPVSKSLEELKTGTWNWPWL
uniref:ATP synthase complex subunit 8 n=2 Tax=Johnius TaxID=240164 RepID=T1X3V6_JOHBE|nr:ATP synthase F0 subunit 8 [Johnius belangerii]AGU46538.1 ATP synthase F0 subunit 8 [Johnius belangerii]QBI38012.1 ATP synthase F0 subunit 8 [Johnius sp. n. BL-2019]